MATKAGKGGAVYLATFPSLALTSPEPTSSADLQNYQIVASGHRYLDAAAVTTLEFSVNAGVNWNPVVNSGTAAYTVQWAGGIVHFLVAQAAGTLIRFSAGKYFVMAAAGNAREWQLSATTGLVDVSVFGSAGKSWQPVLHDHSGSFKQFWIDTTLFSNAFNQLMVLQLYIDSVAGTRFEGYGSIKSDAITAMVNGVIEETVPFQFSGDVYLIP